MNECTRSAAVATTTKAKGSATPSFEETTFEKAVAADGVRINMEMQSNLVRSGSRRTVTLLGETEAIERGVIRRIKWGERGAAVNAAIGLAIYIVNTIVYRSQSTILFIGVATFSFLMFASLAMVYYENVICYQGGC